MIDPNQPVGGFWRPEHQVWEVPCVREMTIEAKHVGGVPLLLWMATRILAAELSRDDMSFHPKNKAASATYEWALDTADGLIAAYNARGEEPTP